jgi:hypothetical protein
VPKDRCLGGKTTRFWSANWNLETSQYKLLQIVLVGRARARFDGTATTQVAGRLEMSPEAARTRRGARKRWSRVELAGTNSHVAAFSPSEASRQRFDSLVILPSLINAISENTLIAGDSCQARHTATAIVPEVAIDFYLEAAPASKLESGFWGCWPRYPDDRRAGRFLQEVLPRFQNRDRCKTI